MSQSHQEQLNRVVLEIEFLLISVIQGVAFSVLAGAAVVPVASLKLETWLYVFAGFLLILIFWAQAIIHSLSFIRWPLDLNHTFLYFVASFFEVMAFTQLENPQKWYGFILAFFCAGWILYIYDGTLIKKHAARGARNEHHHRLNEHVMKVHRLEQWVFMPLGLLFNLGAYLLVRLRPDVFMQNNLHLVLVAVQCLVGLGFLAHASKNFNARSTLIAASLEAELED